MNKALIIKKIRDYIENEFSGEGTGHDWWHVERVAKIARYLAMNEKADPFIVELAALLHDINDFKFFEGNDEKVAPQVKKILKRFKVTEKDIARVIKIIENVSFKGAGVKNEIKSVEGRVVQDADRMDALGAIGIARAFAFGGHLDRQIYNPNIKPVYHKTSAAYKKQYHKNASKHDKGTTINHFYEKLLLLKGRMNTETAKKIAKRRHEFMKKYLTQFFSEWKVSDFKKR